MATISSSIVMNDRMTSVFSNIVSSINTTTRAAQSLNSTQASPNTSGLQLAASQLRIAENELNNMASGANQVNNNLSETPGILDNIKGKIIAAGAAMAAAFSIKKIIEASDQNAQINARISLISDNPEAFKKQLYDSANDARMAFTDMAANASKLGLLAGAAFKDTGEITKFSNLMGKAFKVSGASAEESKNAMYQLTQAMAAGKLQGDEFRSILENAPMLAQAIAKEMKVPMGQLKDMAKDGEITSDVIKNALFNAADDINAKFATMPMTWSDIWTQMQSFMFMTSDGILRKINQVANTQAFQNILLKGKQAFTGLVIAANIAFDAIVGFAKIVADNWTVIEPVILGVAAALATYGAIQATVAVIEGSRAAGLFLLNVASVLQNAATVALAFVTGGYTAAQTAANAAAWAFPGTWIAAIIIGVIVAVIALIIAIVKWGTATNTVAGTVVGIIYWVGAAFYNVWAGIVNGAVWLVNQIIKGFNSMSKGATDIANSIANVFIGAFNAMATAVTSILNGIFEKAHAALSLVDKVAGTSFAGDGPMKFTAVQKGKVNMQAIQVGAVNGGEAPMKYKDLGGAYNKGRDKGNAAMDGIVSELDKLKNPQDLLKGTEGALGGENPAAEDSNGKKTADNTGKMAKQMEITEEDLKYLRDVAEMEYINQFTTAAITVEMNNANTINESSDLDTIIGALVEKVTEASQTIADGVY